MSMTDIAAEARLITDPWDRTASLELPNQLSLELPSIAQQFFATSQL